MEELQRLYGTLVEQDLISIDFNQFASKANDKNYQDKVYGAVMESDLYSGSFLDFQNKFFPTQAATTTPTSTRTRTKTKTKTTPEITSEEQSQIEQDAVNTEFWDKLGGKYKREDFSKNDVGDWVYTNPESGKVVAMEDLISSTSKISKLVSKPIQGMLNELNDEDLRASRSTSKLKDSKNIKLSSDEQLQIEQSAVRSEFWDKAGWTDKKTGERVNVSRDDYFKKNNKWYYKDSRTGTVYPLTKGKRYDELIREDAERGTISIHGLAPELEDFEGGTVMNLPIVGEVNVDYLKAKREYDNSVKSQKIIGETKKTLSDLENEKIDLEVEKTSLDPVEDDERIKEIDKRLEVIDQTVEDQKIKDLEIRKEKGKIEMPPVTTGLVKKDDSESVHIFIDKYTKYGFTFEIDNSGDNITITAKDGSSEKFDVDLGKLSIKQSGIIDKWMRERAVWHDSIASAFASRMNIDDKLDKDIKTSVEDLLIMTLSDEKRGTKASDFFHENTSGSLVWHLSPSGPGGNWYNPVTREAGPWQPSMFSEAGDEKTLLSISKHSDYTTSDEKNITVDINPDTDHYVETKLYSAIQMETIREWKKKNPDKEDWTLQKIITEDEAGFKEIESEIKAEWDELVNKAGYQEYRGEGEMFEGVELEKLKNSGVFKNLITLNSRQNKQDLVTQRVELLVENMGGGVFSKGEGQKGLYKEIEEEYNEISNEAKEVVNQTAIIQNEFDNIRPQLEKESEWLEKNGKTLESDIAKIQNRKFTSQEDVDQANADISELIEEFSYHYENYESLRENSKALYKTALALQVDAEDVLDKEDEFAILSDLMGRNYQIGTQMGWSLTSAAVDLVQGLATAVEAVGYYINPYGRLADYLIDSGVIENEMLKTYIDIQKVVTGVYDPSVRFDDDPETTSVSEKIHGSIDDWQQRQADKIQIPPSYDDIESFADFGEWAGTMFAGQVPQLALLIATGGQSVWLQTALLAGSAGGQKFMSMEEQKKLFEETGGLYGQDFGIDQMFFSSATVGIAEALSERITMGQIKGVGKFLRTNPAAMNGFRSYIRKEVFGSANLKKFGVDLFQEGSSEVVATISENLIDIINGQDVGIFDNVQESFVSGTIISAGIKSPILFHHMTAPFISPNNKAIIDNNQRRIDQLLGLISTGRPTDKTVKEWEEIENKYIQEIDLLYKNSQDTMAFDIKRVDVMNTEQGEKHKRELIDIHNENKRLEKQVTENTNNPDLTEIERTKRYNELNNKWKNNNQRKSEILGQYTPDVANNKYDRMWNSVKARAKEFTLETDLQVDMTDGNSVDMIEWMSNQDGYDVVKNEKTGEIEQIVIDENTRKGLINKYKNILNDPNLSKKERKADQKRLDLLESDAIFSAPPDVIRGIIGESNNYGAMIPKFDNDGNLEGYNMFINKSTSYDNGKFNTAAHEFLHGVLYQTLQQDAGTQQALTKTILDTLNKKGVVVSDAIMETINVYAQDGARAEEILTIVSEAYIDGDIKIPKSGILGMKDFFRRWSQNKVNGRDIAFDTDEDVINFIKDYSYSMKNNKQNRALTRMMKSGVSGKLIAKAQEHRDEIKKNTPTKGEAMFSRNVDQELNNNPDLLTEIDAFVKNEDGTPKYTDKNTWQTSTDFVDAWSMITQSKKLDGLIQAGMVGEGVNTAQALGEFTRKVKDELGERLLKNFNPAKNDSLFGWLTGVSGGMGKSVIYRAKGDVMVEYSKQLKTVSIDTDITTTEGDTFSSQLEGEPDVEMEKLETEVITIGKETVKRSDVDIVFLESVNANKTIVRSINNIVENSGVNLEGLTYNGTKKNIVKHDGGKPKSKRKPVGPLYKVLDIVSGQFGVDGMRIIKEQDLTSTQRTLAREYINEHAQKLIDMLPEGENKSGDATGVANTVLGEFYIKGERISMAVSATGKGKISQTKRDDITVAEFTEFFNKPGTKSDGAIRALITQAATISANQAIRLNAISKQADPISTIALVGDGKSAMMFSKASIVKNLPQLSTESFQEIGAIDRNLSQEAKDNFWTNIHVFASENILDRNLDSIRIALQNTYKDFPGVLENVDQIARSIHNVVKQVKDPIIKNPIKLSEKLLTSNENQLTKVQQSSGSNIDAAEAYRDAKRVSNYVATTTVLANQIFDPSNPGLSIAKIMMMKGHLASSGKNSYLKRKQIFPGTKEFLANTLGKIPGIEYTTKKSKDGKISLATVTYNGQEIVMSSILSSQSSGTALSDTKSEVKMEKRDVNEDIAQETLNDIVTFYSDLFKRGEIDNVDLMMVKASLLSGMNSVLARAAKLKYVSENANSFKDPGKQLRYEHMLPRVAVIINMFDAHINKDGISNVKEHLKNYTVQIIPVTMDKAISDAKLGSSLLENQTFQDPSWIRNYNSRTEGDKRLVAIKDITTGEVIIPSKAFVLTNDILLKNRKANIAFSKAVNQANITNENTPSRGMSAFDFDETVGISDNFVIAKKNGKTKKIASDQWPFVGETMKEEGWEMDFTDFDKVTKGRPGPLMEKLRNRIKKFGPENNYIVTARSPESETNIHAYLKSENINIPLENITGLGNSTGAAKALWITEKFAEGYNDIYFVDDALPNVEAVKNVMDQLDIKGKAVQAKIQFSKSMNPEFNNILNGNVQTELDINRILEQTKGVKAEAVFSEAQAKVRGIKKGKWKFWVPYSAEDFKGLIYRFVGKGRQGEGQMAFFKKALFDPFNRAYEAMNGSKQRLESEYRSLLKEFPDIKKSLNKTVGNTNFTTAQAVRVYLWNKAGFEIPGLSQRDLNALIRVVEGDADTLAFADSLGIISNQEAGYTQPGDYWMVENIQSDINTINNEINRADHLAEWKQNIETMFGTWENGRLVGPNINKIEAIYGTKFREALEDMVWRMEFGTKRQQGSNRLVNSFNNWANQSVGAIMFFNMRSALLQTISSINYLNWSDNNPLKAGLALANFPQFIKDFSMIFNSDMLKQRRGGQQRGINEAELAEAVAGSKNTPKAMLHWLLTKGFLPTQIADSFAIASGGATFYRNRVNSLLKQGLTQEQSEARAWEDFQENTEESQQSARPDMISQQQASPLGRYILAFKNTPMQYARLTKKAFLDLVNRRGDAKTNIGKIMYYMAVQNLIFSALQTSLGAMIGDDDEEKEAKAYERTINSMIDSILGGLGFGGNVVAVIKNTIQEYIKQEGKGWNADHTYTILRFLGLSPTISSKARKLYSAIQTKKFNEDVMKEMDLLDIDNPTWSVIANIISAVTNVPLDRLVKKIDNIDAAITEDLTAMERLALLMGWNTWDLDVDDSDVLAVEDEIKEKKEEEKKIKKEEKKEEKKKEKEKEEKIIEESFIEDQKQERKEGKKDITCVAVNKSGKRCKTKVKGSNKYCTIHESVEQGTKEVQCKKIKSNKKRCGMMTKAKSGYCYYHD